MKTKRGFTITELLAVIVILSILMLLATATYTGISKRIKESSLNQKISYFKEKALEYAEEYEINNETISLNYLINLGYVAAEYPENPEQERIENPVTGGFLDCMNFTITKDLTEYSVTHDLEGSCDLVANEQKANEITIEKYVKRDNRYIKITDEWVKEPVYLLVKFANINKYTVIDNKMSYQTSAGEKEKTGMYCSKLTDSLDAVSNCYNVNLIDTNYIYNSNVTVSMNLQNRTSSSDSKAFKISKGTLIKIDKEAPTIKVDYSRSYAKSSIPVTLSGSDGLGSGIAGYYFGQARPDSNTIFSDETKYDIYYNGTYYAYVKDLAGNISLEQEIKISTIDQDGPEGYLSNYGRTTWTTDDFTFTFGCGSDSKTGCANEVTYTIIDTTDNKNKVLADNVKANSRLVTYTVQAPEESYLTSITLKYTIKDNLGNTVTYGDDTPIKINTYIDKVTPTFKIDVDGTADRGFLWRLKGYDYDLTSIVTKKGPSDIDVYGYTERFSSVNRLKNYTDAELDQYFTKSRYYSTYVSKRKTTLAIGRVRSGSGITVYNPVKLSGKGCVHFLGWTIGGAIIGGLIGGLIGWGACHAY